jgi:hypothetical protein
MQGNHSMTPNAETTAPPSPQTTTAGRDAWLSGAHAGSDFELPTAAIPESGAIMESSGVGPVNAAEALALSLSHGTFSGARKLTGADGAELVVDPARDAYYFESTSLKPIDALLQQPAAAWTPVYSEALRRARAASGAPQPLARLRWYSGLIATPGILSRALSRAVRYRLSNWPETEREFPKHFRIAKEMVKIPITVDEIVAASGTPYEDVVDYVNACFAAGRLEAASGADTAAPRLSRRQRLIARLNKPLFAR